MKLQRFYINYLDTLFLLSYAEYKGRFLNIRAQLTSQTIIGIVRKFITGFTDLNFVQR